MLTSGAAHAGGIVDHNSGKDKSNGKLRRRESILQPNRPGERGDECGVRTGHAACAEEQMPMEFSRVEIIKRHFDDLRQSPR
jgi:hypothetical protein